MNKDEIYITILIATWFIGTVGIFTYVLNLWPIKSYVKINALKEQLKDRKVKLFNSITNDSVSLSLFLLLIGIIFFIFLIWLKRPEPVEFLEGIQVELFGILFDIIVLVLLFNWINKKGEKNRKIETALNEIEDFRTWHSDESKYRIIGNLKRLNREGWSEVNLMESKLSGTNQPRGDTDLRNINLSKSSLLSAEFEYCNLFNANFSNTTCHFTKFMGSGLGKANFSGSHLQGTDFNGCSLFSSKFIESTITSNVSFENADIRNIDFTNAIFNSAKFHNAEVSDKFVEDLKRWKIKGNKVFNDYVFVKVPVAGRQDMFRYFLRQKSGLTQFMITDNVDLNNIKY